METVSIAIVCSLISCIIGISGYARLKNKDAEDGGFTKAKLDYISKGVDDIRLDIRDQGRKINDINDRLIRVEESTKSAHKRINDLEKGEM